MLQIIPTEWPRLARRRSRGGVWRRLGAGWIAMTLVAGLSFVLAQCSASAEPVPPSKSTSPVENLDHLWQLLDANYALFDAKGVDWDALRKVYRPQVSENMSDDELFAVMSRMLGHLNDNHVNLFRGDTRFCSGVLNGMTMDDFSPDLVRSKYLKSPQGEKLGGVFYFGRLTDRIGYFHFSGFRNLSGSGAAVDEILEQLGDCDAIVVDVRANHGGDDRVGRAIANRFADRKRLYMTTALRNGPGHKDFALPKHWHVEPEGPSQFRKPVILLTHRFSVSAADNFTLAMRVLPHVTHVGDFTSGCYADNYRERLPNGWVVSISYNLFLDHRGVCWEGIGIAPDLVQRGTRDALAGGTDRPLEFAIRLLEAGPPAPRRETGSLEAVRPSLAAQLDTTIRESGLAAADELYQRARAEKFATWAIDQEELNELAQRLMANRQAPAAIAVAEWHALAFPRSWQAEQGLAKLHLQNGDKQAAKHHYQRAIELNRRAKPWDRDGYDRASAQIKALGDS